ncbi:MULTISPECIES: hypothetical protein [Pseudomonas]|uniref:Uncharacterized protein n=1 Tax=Pseudomonas lutea TaxID=243924 RepID=A0A9X8MH32_9PSED|nr:MULTISPECIES: hypothetical protein [Pseudomonas]SER36399.1 hypothetical protein SAMN05216409_11850 [Pseudomonas lutea]
MSYALMKRNREVLEIAWRPLIKNRTAASGERERYCPACEEWLPMTDHWFRFIAARGYYRSICLDCETSEVRERRSKARVLARIEVTL